MKLHSKVRKTFWTANVLGMALLFNGCALNKDYIAASYVPQVGITKLPEAEKIFVNVQVTDERTIRDRVSVKKNGYGMEMAPIIATNDVAALLKTAIETELTDRGFHLGDSNLTIVAHLSKFYSDFKTGFWSGSAVAEATLEIQLKTADGQTRFSKLVTGEGTNPNLQLASGSNAKIALDAAFKDAMAKLFGDPQFMDALLKPQEPSVQAAEKST
jgi:uncharacterized lipoprotein YajG